VPSPENVELMIAVADGDSPFERELRSEGCADLARRGIVHVYPAPARVAEPALGCVTPVEPSHQADRYRTVGINQTRDLLRDRMEVTNAVQRAKI
jgi:hypothetical protein